MDDFKKMKRRITTIAVGCGESCSLKEERMGPRCYPRSVPACVKSVDFRELIPVCPLFLLRACICKGDSRELLSPSSCTATERTLGYTVAGGG